MGAVVFLRQNLIGGGNFHKIELNSKYSPKREVGSLVT